MFSTMVTLPLLGDGGDGGGGAGLRLTHPLGEQ
jgi:hypothetical protein